MWEAPARGTSTSSIARLVHASSLWTIGSPGAGGTMYYHGETYCISASFIRGIRLDDLNRYHSSWSRVGPRGTTSWERRDWARRSEATTPYYIPLRHHWVGSLPTRRSYIYYSFSCSATMNHWSATFREYARYLPPVHVDGFNSWSPAKGTRISSYTTETFGSPSWWSLNPRPGGSTRTNFFRLKTGTVWRNSLRSHVSANSSLCVYPPSSPPWRSGSDNSR